ncbi:ribbon-helix-helix domain-containing protein [Lichenifustis flavocetrariae]|uniref:Antitoxin-like ribbon-helix-helix domain-containing protein n=1 Tax=Lichenifustis flavocetrariae TaxID=2949735 RepID=A0AA41Z137_9HYPH|nr:ribbon-helix-helix domain-containing protein [Lichenifustis flavocetrariae]MCW6512276.1 hypothetical protein [Lichenifustis flavocetrariae]
MTSKNSLQAVLDRQKAANTDTQPSQPAPPEAADYASQATKFVRPVREGKKFVGGHFTPNVAKQLRLLAAEEETTTQALLEEALELLFIKKGKGSLQRG